MNRLQREDFSKFVSTHADRIYNHAFRMLRDRLEAEEAVQDIFLKVHRALADFRGDSELRTWLYRITVNTCLTRLRKKPQANVYPDGPDGIEAETQWDSIADDENDPEKLLIEKESKHFVIKALEKVSADDKEILLLFHVDELKYEEIAGVLGIPVGTVCTRLYRARKNLRHIMQKELER